MVGQQQGAPAEPTGQHPIVSEAELQQGALVEPIEQHPIVSGVGIQRAAVGTEVLKKPRIKESDGLLILNFFLP